jgi:hypothetical protein
MKQERKTHFIDYIQAFYALTILFLSYALYKHIAVLPI